MHIFVILTNVLKEFDLKIEYLLIFMIINHCCGFITALGRGQIANSVFEKYEDRFLSACTLISFLSLLMFCSSVDSECLTVLEK